VARIAQPAYAADLSVSDKISERGRWSDRLAAIDADIAQMAESHVFAADARAEPAMLAIQERSQRRPAPCSHVRPPSFAPGAALRLNLAVTDSRGITGATCYYRHVNQAERFQLLAMTKSAAGYQTVVPAFYTNSPYPLQYYFVVHEGSRAAHLYPGLGADRLQVPYFVVTRAR